jgi:hypothetical protein
MPSTDISAGRDCGLRRKLGILATMYFEKTYFDKDCGSKGFFKLWTPSPRDEPKFKK